MLISVTDLQKYWNVNPSSILHVGAHEAEENSAYRRAGWGNAQKIYWVESQPDKVNFLKNFLDSNQNEVIQATVWGKSGIKKTFQIANNSQSSSLLNLGTHKFSYPGVRFSNSYEVSTSTLSEVIPSEVSFEFINIDIQGAELEALKGFEKRLNVVNWLYLEVNKDAVYESCALVEEIDAYLNEFGFRRVTTRWVFGASWGDALYVNEKLDMPSIEQRIKWLAQQFIWILKKSFKQLLRIVRNKYQKNL